MRYLHTMVRVHDADESLDFYCNKLGLVEIRRIESEAGRFTLIFLAAPEDSEAGERNSAPLLELTYNWDPEDYTGGRNFGHLAFESQRYLRTLPVADGQRCHHQPPSPRRAHGLRPVARWNLDRACSRKAAPWMRRSPGPLWKTPAPGKPIRLLRRIIVPPQFAIQQSPTGKCRVDSQPAASIANGISR